MIKKLKLLITTSLTILTSSSLTSLPTTRFTANNAHIINDGIQYMFHHPLADESILRGKALNIAYGMCTELTTQLDYANTEGRGNLWYADLMARYRIMRAQCDLLITQNMVELGGRSIATILLPGQDHKNLTLEQLLNAINKASGEELDHRILMDRDFERIGEEYARGELLYID